MPALELGWAPGAGSSPRPGWAFGRPTWRRTAGLGTGIARNAAGRRGSGPGPEKSFRSLSNTYSREPHHSIQPPSVKPRGGRSIPDSTHKLAAVDGGPSPGPSGCFAEAGARAACRPGRGWARFLAALGVAASMGLAGSLPSFSASSPASSPASSRASSRAVEPAQSPGSSIIVAGQPVEVGHPVVLWSDPQCVDGYQTHCIDQAGGCCDSQNKRDGVRAGWRTRRLDELKGIVSQFVLHFDGCVNSRSCFKSMHNRPRPSGAGCGLSAHFMIDADGTIYQTLDLVERAFHAEEANSDSIGVEICNRGRVDRSEWPKLPPAYPTRVTREAT